MSGHLSTNSVIAVLLEVGEVFLGSFDLEGRFDSGLFNELGAIQNQAAVCAAKILGVNGQSNDIFPLVLIHLEILDIALMNFVALDDSGSTARRTRRALAA